MQNPELSFQKNRSVGGALRVVPPLRSTFYDIIVLLRRTIRPLDHSGGSPRSLGAGGWLALPFAAERDLITANQHFVQARKADRGLELILGYGGNPIRCVRS